MTFGSGRARQVTETVTRAAGKVTVISVVALVVAVAALVVAWVRS
jgi:hypothetical protein